MCRHKASYCDELVDWPRPVFKVLRAAFSVAINGGFWIGALFCRGARACQTSALRFVPLTVESRFEISDNTV